MANTVACPVSETAGPLGLIGWTRLAAAAGLAILMGHTAADLARFPLYAGSQGVLFQQPALTAIMAVVAGIASLAAAYVLALPLVPPVERQQAPAFGALALAGFSLRGGTLGSVLQAADGAWVYWLLLVELAIWALLLGGLWTIHRRFVIRCEAGAEAPKRHAGPDEVTKSIAVQAVVTAVMLLILGQSYAKGQALGSVLTASLVGAWVASVATGCMWRQGWVVPLVVGMIGYAVNAVVASGVETAALTSRFSGLGIALPLDYAAMGAVGVLLGEISARHEPEEPLVASRS